MISNKYSAVHAGVVVLVWVVLAVLGGPSNAFDKWAVDVLAAERLAHPFLTHAGIRVSFAGSAPFTLGLTLLGTAFLVWRGRHFHAVSLAGLVLSGRLMVDVLKQSTMRPRPDLELHGVAVHSLSFPSGHAANSMIAFVAIALLCAPERHRRMALTVAIAASLVIGATRPLLGVHWPSDVLAGWIFGLLWVVGWWRILDASSLGLPTPSQSGRTGGDMARDVGSRDKLARGTGKDNGVTRVHKSDKPNEGDEPDLPNRG